MGERTIPSINNVEEVGCLPVKEKSYFLSSRLRWLIVGVNLTIIKNTWRPSITLFLSVHVRVLLENMSIGI